MFGSRKQATNGWHKAKKKSSRASASCLGQSSSGSAAGDSQLASTLLWLADAGILALLFVAPLFFGGRNDLGRGVFVALAVAAAVAWFARQSLVKNATWYRSFAFIPLLLAVGLVVVQLIPLPVDWLAVMSPRHAELLPAWTANANFGIHLGEWTTLSFAPSETQASLTVLLALVFLFAIVVQRIRNLDDVERLLRWTALASVAMAAFGLLQYFTSDGRYFWFYKHPYELTNTQVVGSFTNRNHFCHFIVLGFASLLAWIIGAQTNSNGEHSGRRASLRVSRGLLFAAIAISVCAVLLTQSRGGVIALFVAATVFTAICWQRRLVQRQYVVGAVGLGVVVLGLLSIYGYDQAVQRMSGLAEGSLEAVDHNGSRRRIWKANIEAFQAGGLAGGGAGTHRFLHAVYLKEPSVRESSHAESSYLQIASENGMVGAGLAIVLLGCCGWWCLSAVRHAESDRAALCAAAVSAGIAASMVHGIVDFVWHIPACATLTVVLAACGLRLSQLCQTSANRAATAIAISRPRWLEACVAVSLVGAWMIYSTAGPAVGDLHWDRYRISSVARNQLTSKQNIALNRALLNNTSQSSEDAEQFLKRQHLLTGIMISELEQTVECNPGFARAQLRLAERLVEQFENEQRSADNSMSITQIRDAAIASQFQSSQALRNWLEKAFGTKVQFLYRAYQHAQLAMQLSPLQGEAYVQTAKLCFLAGRSEETTKLLMEQAIVVGPNDPEVLFAVGMQHLLASRQDEALRAWAKSFQLSASQRQRILQLLAGRLPAGEFVEAFQPQWDSLYKVFKGYAAAGQPDDIEQLIEYAEQLASTNHPNAASQTVSEKKMWILQHYTLARIYSHAGHHVQSLSNWRKAYEMAPVRYDIRLQLAHSLMENECFAEAETHYRWCLARQPQHGHLQRAVVHAAKEQALRQRDSRQPISQQRTAIGVRQQQSTIQQ